MRNLEVPTVRIEDAIGVCNVRQDTRLLAQEADGASAEAGTARRALDLGTGSGYVGIYLALRGWSVDATDVSPRALKQAEHNATLNGVQLRVIRSDLFEAVTGSYDVIACNPPMRRDETEASRLLTTTLRRIGPLANLLMRLTQPFLERKRLNFLAEIARGARKHLNPGGRLVLVISPWEAQALVAQVPALKVVASRPVDAIPGLQVVTFEFIRAAGRDEAEAKGDVRARSS